jgi:[calcium/calmodulin-dependent protein kinase] kinase
LHKKDIIHRDVKPENIIFSRDLKTCKLIDFGVSFKNDDDNKGSELKGTMRFMSPE